MLNSFFCPRVRSRGFFIEKLGGIWLVATKIEKLQPNPRKLQPK
jgi:hypothetical protein